MDLAALIRDVPDFPQPGVLFKDITTLLRDPAGFRAGVDRLTAAFVADRIDVVVGLESRGFIFGAPLAYRLGTGFVPIRKYGKLPADRIHVEYELEYGSAAFEIHTDAVKPGQRVLIVDDLLATGGTARAAVDLIERLGGEVVACAFLIELAFLHGRDRLPGRRLVSLITYP